MKPAIIIGAPRSGTNILRDTLTRLPRLVTWPCDEINLVWRHGNIDFPNDELPPDRATPEVQEYLRRQFRQLGDRRVGSRVVEKTCANSLRVDFVDRVFPEASYIFIVRDGIDAVASAMLRWTAPLDVRYTLRKLRHAPITDLPYYIPRFIANRWHRLRAKDRRLASWGPVFAGMEEVAENATLEELCALQWLHCVRRAEESLVRITPQRVLRLHYEDLARRPRDTIEEICDFLDLDVGEETIVAATASVHTGSIGKGHQQLTPTQQTRIEDTLVATCD